MKIKKTAITLAAIFGFALLSGGCSGTDSNHQKNSNTTTAPTAFDNTVTQWQNGSVTFVNQDQPVTFAGPTNSAPALYDVDGNGTLDLVVGDAAGYITIMINDSYDGINIVDSYQIGDASGPAFFCTDAAPAVFDAVKDGYWDMIVGCGDGTAMYLDFYDLTPGAMVALAFPIPVDGTTLVLASGYAVPTVAYFGDAHDALYDLMIGAGDGSVNYYINNGTAADPALAAGFRVGVFGTRAAVTNGDLSGDGASDLVVGNQAGNIYACQGLTDACVFVMNSGSLAKPAVGDINHDGLLDLVIGSADGSLMIITATP